MSGFKKENKEYQEFDILILARYCQYLPRTIKYASHSSDPATLVAVQE